MSLSLIINIEAEIFNEFKILLGDIERFLYYIVILNKKNLIGISYLIFW